jgi:hypothetical protein
MRLHPDYSTAGLCDGSEYRSDCHFCELARNGYQFMGRPVLVPRAMGNAHIARTSQRPVCIHLGTEVATARCIEGCGRGIKLKVFNCRLHQTCTMEKWGEGVHACCSGCPDKSTEESTAPRTWECGLTTVPERRENLLPRTLASIRAAGFPGPRIFVDGASSGYEGLGLPVTYREDRVLTAGNWHLAVMELYHRNPHADFYAMFQDDLVLSRGVREYIERSRVPSNSYFNLFNGHDNGLPPGGREGWYPSNQCGRGAVALAFSRHSFEVLLSSSHLVKRIPDPVRGTSSIDGGILEAMRIAGHAELIHWPSLADHTGTVSTMGNQTYQHHHPSFPGEDFDVLELLKEVAR